MLLGYIFEVVKSKPVSAVDCLHYALSLPTSVVITGIDSKEVLEQAFEAAKTFPSVKPGDITAMLQKTAGAASDGNFELFKTSTMFDGTAAHPEWLG